MIRKRALRPKKKEASLHFLSDSGDVLFKSVIGDADPPTSNVFVDDSRLPRSATASTSFAHSPSLLAAALLGEASTSKKPFFHVEEQFEKPLSGLPEDWFIFPLPKALDDRATSSRNDDVTIDLNKSDYACRLQISVRVERSTFDTLPRYRSRTTSLGQFDDLLPTYYPADDFADNLSDVVQAIYEQNDEFLKRPKLRRPRPSARDFSLEEQRELRRKTRHRICVVICNSLGLTVTLGLFFVAPQMLTAVAISGFCLGVGAHKLHKHFKFLRWNNPRVRKRNVVVAVIESVAVKLLFLAITPNGDDFLVLTHRLAATNPGISVSSVPPVPVFSHLNHIFLKPVETLQELLGLSSTAERVMELGSGGWQDPANTILKNMLLVGTVQMAPKLVV